MIKRHFPAFALIVACMISSCAAQKAGTYTVRKTKNVNAEKIERDLQYNGYYGSTIDSVVSRKGKTLRYEVTRGESIIIDTVVFDIKASESFALDFLADSLEIQSIKGKTLSAATLESERERSLSSLKHKGYYSIDQSLYKFTADSTSLGHGKAALLYSVSAENLKPYNFGKVSISYPQSMKAKVIRGMNIIDPGTRYNDETVSNTYSRYSSMRTFQKVEITMKEDADSANVVNATIDLTESKPMGFKGNLEVSTNSSGLIGVAPKLSIYHKNVFGGGEWLNVGFTGNFQFRLDDDTRATEFGTSVSLSLPRFLGLDYKHFKGPSVPRTEMGFAFNHQNRPEYTRNLFSASYGYSGVHKKLYYQVYPFQVNHVRLFNLDDSFAEKLQKNPYMKYSYQDHSDIGISGSIFYNSSTEAVPKTDYRTARLQIDLSGNIISTMKGYLAKNAAGQGLVFGAPFSQYSKIEASVSRGLRFGEDDSHSVAVRLLGGIGHAYGNSTTLPYEKQFYCGGANGMRGWQSRALGPGYSPMDEIFSIPSQTGDVKLEADIEYRFPLVWKLEGALFAEAGNVWELKEGVDLGALAADWGLGLRLNFDIILIRVDMGLRLRDPSLEEMWLTPVRAISERGYALHFGVGYPF